MTRRGAGARREPTLLVGRLTGDFVRVRLAGSPLEPPDEEGGPWVRGLIDVSVGPFRASYDATLAFAAFARLREGLDALESGGAAEAGFDPLEPCLVFDVRANGRGQFVAEGSLHPMAARAHRLAFSIDLDARDVRDMARGLDRILEARRAPGPVDAPRG